MIEQAYTFGESNALVGVLTESPKVPLSKDVAVIILNSGLIQKSGPFRLSTLLARELADQGVVSLRFDISGIGDSKKHRDARTRHDQIMSDISSAMDFISNRKGIKKFIILGICTGADNAHKISTTDQRVVGAVFMDGYAYPTFKFHVNQWRSKAKTPLKLAAHILRLCRQTLCSRKEQGKESREDNYFWELPPKRKTEKELIDFVRRDMRLLYVFTGNWETFSYQQQLHDSFKAIDFKNCLQVEYLKDAHHIYVTRKSRQDVIQVILSWVNKNF